jgi:hypothetical protein
MKGKTDNLSPEDLKVLEDILLLKGQDFPFVRCQNMAELWQTSLTEAYKNLFPVRQVPQFQW